MQQHTKSGLLELLEKEGIETKTYDHPRVLTIEEQAKYVGHLKGGHSKNLLLKDKKNRLILVSALTTTKIDMKVLSQRLGLGKGGVRLAPEDVMQAVLKVPLGCVTPFAMLNQSARSVVLLLDESFKSKDLLYFHPLSNDATTAISPNGLEMFLQSLGRQAAYVNFEEDVVVGKDQPPDLAVFLLDATPADNVLKEQIKPVSMVKGSPMALTSTSEVNIGGKTEGTQKKATISTKDVLVPSPADVLYITTSILDKLSSKITIDVLEQKGKEVGSGLPKVVRQELMQELEGILMALKNTAYTEGFIAGMASSSMGR